MTTTAHTAAKRATTRKQSELAQLIAEHRVVHVTHTESEHFTITARVDMPEWNVKAGEIVHLAASSHPGYYYPVIWDTDWNRHACRCNSYEFRHHCKHGDHVNEICRERAHQRQSVPVRQHEDWPSSDVPVYASGTGNRPVATIPVDDLPAHIDDSIASGEGDWIDAERAAWANATPDERRAMYCDDFGIYDYEAFGAA